MKKKAIILSASASLLLILIFIFYTFILGKSENTSPVETKKAEMSIIVRSSVISKKPFESKIITTGSIISNEEVELHSEVSGKITKINFREGGHVKKGDLLIKINDADLQTSLSKAKYKKELAEKNEYRLKILLEKNGTSQESYDNILNELHQAEADINFIQAQIEKTEIHAPFDGIIGLRYVSEGSYISPLIKIATLQNIDPLKIDFSIPQVYYNNLSVGKTIEFRITGKEDNYKATIYAIEPKVDLSTRTLQVRALCANTGGLYPGSYIEVEINLSNMDDAIMIPSEALIPDIQGEIVYLYKNGKAIQQRVTSAIRTEKEVQITSGLKAGDTIIVSGIIQLKPGIAVKLSDGVK